MMEIQKEPGSSGLPQTTPSLPLEMLRCPRCRKSRLTELANELACSSCRNTFPLRDGRFPDFLSSTDRRELDAEARFWEEHYGNQVYQDESESSYAMWSSWMGTGPHDKVLEIGCGSGALLTRLTAGLRVGLEPVIGLLTKTHGFLGVIGVATNMPFPDNSFDVVYFKHSLHHVQDKWAAFREAIRVTRPGGKVIVMEPNLDHPQRRITSNPNSFFRKQKWIVRFIGPVEYFQTSQEISDWAEVCGVHLNRIQFTESQYDKLSVRQKLQRVYRVLGRLFFIPRRFLYPNYYIEMTKV